MKRGPDENQPRKEAGKAGEASTSANEGSLHTSASNTNDNSPGILPQTATAAAKVAEDVAKGVKSTIEGVVAWTEAKAAKLSEHREDGTGPYDSPGTCAPSDQDAIGAGILPAMPPATPEKCDVEKNGSTPDHGELKPGGKDHE